MWVVIKDETVAESNQKLLYPLKATIDQISWDGSFR